MVVNYYIPRYYEYMHVYEYMYEYSYSTRIYSRGN